MGNLYALHRNTLNYLNLIDLSRVSLLVCVCFFPLFIGDTLGNIGTCVSPIKVVNIGLSVDGGCLIIRVKNTLLVFTFDFVFSNNNLGNTTKISMPQ